jgi:hypothetical protein
MDGSNWITIDENALIEDIRNTLTPEDIFDMRDIVNCVLRNGTEDEIIDFLKDIHIEDPVYKRILKEVIPIQLILNYIENISITKQDHSHRFTYLDVNDIEKYLTDTEQHILWSLKNKILFEKEKEGVLSSSNLSTTHR